MPDAAAAPSASSIELLERLIAFPTVSRDSNLGLIEWVRDHLARQGVACRLTYDAQAHKANLFATVGEGSQPGMLLSGHTDVVPVDGQPWTSDPFVATQRDGRLYGRGSADMKGFIAVALSLVPRMLAQTHGAPVHLALSYDEEVGCLGVRGLIEDLARSGARIAGCIVGEPTRMAVALGHKGSRVYRCCVRGREAHSSLAPSGVNAIEHAAMLITHIRELAEQLRDNEAREPGFDVPFSTLQTGRIQGGIATNVVPRDCEFRFDMRHLAATDPDQLFARIESHARDVVLPRMREVAPDSEIRFDMLGDVPEFNTAVNAPLVSHVQRWLGESDPAPRYVGFGTEAGLFQRAGITPVVCGPGAIEQAHKPDEFIELSQLARCEQFLDNLIHHPLHLH